MSIISSGAAITLRGNAVYPAISTANAAGAGGAIVVGAALTTGILTSTGTTAGGAVTAGINCIIPSIDSSGVSLAGGAVNLGRETSCGAILASGASGGTVTLGDECTVTTITSKPLAGAGAGGVITIADDCTTGNIDSSGTVAVTTGGNFSAGDRCELGSVTNLGVAGGGAVTYGDDCKSLAIDCRSTASGNGGALTLGARNLITGAVTCSGAGSGGVIVIGLGTIITATLTASGAGGTSGPATIGAGGAFGDLLMTATGVAGNIILGKFCVVGQINGSSSGSSTGTTDIGDGCTINTALNRNALTTSGVMTIGNSVTVAGLTSTIAGTGAAGSITTGRGCNLQQVNAFSSSGNGGDITLGASTTAFDVRSHTGGGAGDTSGNIIIGAGCTVLEVRAHSPLAGANSGSITMEPGSTCTGILLDSLSGIGGALTLKNANVVAGLITMGTSSTGTILSINSKISDQIDNVNGTSLFRDLVGSTPAANRDFIANLTASGSQYTNCLIVPNGTGVSINATVPRTVIAYQFLQKNAFPANVTLSEGSETTSANLLAP